MPGSYQSAAGKSSCILCESGKFAPEHAQSNCLPCDTQVTLDRRNCSSNACPRNYQYDPLRGCTVCPLGSSASSGGACGVCVADFYTPDVGLDCTSCRQAGMTGLVCTNGLASIEVGYWAYTVQVEGSGSASSMQFRAAMCPPNTCPGGPLQSASLGGNSSSSQQQSVTLASPCLPPRASSPLCGECADGYVVWGADCARCDGTRIGMIVLCIVLSYALVLFFLLSDASSAGFLQILLYFGQTAMLIVGPLATWLSFMSFFNFSPNSTTECLANITPYQQLLFSVLMPLLLLIELGSTALLQWLVQPLLRRAAHWSWLPARVQSWRQSACVVDLDRYRACALVLLTFSYTQVSRSCIAYLNCVEVGDLRVVFSNPTMYCDSSVYQTYRILVVVVLLTFVIGFPLGSILFLRSHKGKVEAAVQLASQRRVEAEQEAARTPPESPSRSRRDSSSGSKPAAAASTDCSTFLSRYGPLFASYRGKAWWWSSTTLIRRALFTTVDVALVAEPATKFMAFSFLNFYTLCGHSLMQPFVSEELNHAEWASQAMLVTISVLLTAHPPPYSLSMQLALFLLTVPLTILLALLVVRQLRPLLLQLAVRIQAAAIALRMRLSARDTAVTKYTPSAMNSADRQASNDAEEPRSQHHPPGSHSFPQRVSPRMMEASEERIASPLLSPSGVQMSSSPTAKEASPRRPGAVRHTQLPPLLVRSPDEAATPSHPPSPSPIVIVHLPAPAPASVSL